MNAVGWTPHYDDSMCLAHSYYAGGVLAVCEAAAGHGGEHAGRDRWGFNVFWAGPAVNSNPRCLHAEGECWHGECADPENWTK